MQGAVVGAKQLGNSRKFVRVIIPPHTVVGFCPSCAGRTLKADVEAIPGRSNVINRRTIPVDGILLFAKLDTAKDAVIPIASLIQGARCIKRPGKQPFSHRPGSK